MIIQNALIEWYKFNGLESTIISLYYKDKDKIVRKEISIKGAYHFGIGFPYDLSISNDGKLQYAFLKYGI